ncbi:MAG: glycosyltransferase [Clostridia bacterium]|nr:glycosyltransferase [Clostridia bacterium]
MKKIKINFSDFWDDLNVNDNYFTNLLKQHYDVEISPNPDYLFCSVFGSDHLKYDCIKIFYTGENLCPDFNLVDYALGFHQIAFDDRYLRLPLYIMYQEACEKAQKKHLFEDDYYLSKKNFCNYVISNSISDSSRDRMIQVLSSYKELASGGKYKNNVGGPVPNKIAFEKNYKFTMCFENTGAIGYTTEKIMEAFAGDTIPIYWGNPMIAKEFNPKAFINCHDYSSFEEVLNEVKRIDSNDSLFLEMIKAPIFTEASSAAVYLKNDYLLDFLKHIIDQPIEKAIRRNKIYLGERYEHRAKVHWKLDKALYYPRRLSYYLQNRLRIIKNR